MKFMNESIYCERNGKLIHAYRDRKETFSNIDELTPFSGSNDFVIPMFSVPLVHIEIKDWNNKKQQLLNLYNTVYCNNYVKGNCFDVKTDYHYNTETSSNYSPQIHNILSQEISLAQDILLHPNDFYNFDLDNPYEGGCNGEYFFRLENSWFESSLKGSRHEVHNHGPVGYSCVVFIEYDKEEHSPTRFLNPYFSSFFGNNCDFCPDHLVKEGSLIIFPSPVLHFTHPNTSDKIRLILSWNMTVINEFGDRVFA